MLDVVGVVGEVQLARRPTVEPVLVEHRPVPVQDRVAGRRRERTLWTGRDFVMLRADGKAEEEVARTDISR